MLLGHARGKVGDLVFSRTNGQQVVRARAAVVKNPQTQSQMIQRIILNTVAQAYSKMQPIVDHSFEGVQAGQKTMSAFLRRNIAVLRDKVAAAVADAMQGLGEVRAFTPIGSNQFSPNAFVISAGTLPQLTPSIASSTTASVSLGGSTYADIISSLGLQRGDQLTFVAITGGARNYYFEYARIILDPTNADGSQAALSAPLLTEGAVNLPSPRNTGDFNVLSLSAEGVLTFLPGSASRQIYCVGVIVSRKGADGNWLRSNAQLVANEDYLADFYSMDECLIAIEEGSIETLSARFLNNAGSGRLAVASNSDTISVGIGTQEAETATVTLVGTAEIASTNGDVNATLLAAVDSEGKKYPIQILDSNSAILGRLLCAAGSAVSTVQSSQLSAFPGIESDYVRSLSFDSELTEWIVRNSAWSFTALYTAYTGA